MLRVLGLIGGMSWESTAEYYRHINRGIAARLGGLHSASMLLHTIDFAPLAELQKAGKWDEAGKVLARSALTLERAGAEAIVMTSNTMHQVASAIEDAVRIPLLHIVDPTGRALESAGVKRAGLLGTSYTMELPFWKERMARRFGISVLTPEADDRAMVHKVIFEELCLGQIRGASREAFGKVAARLAAAGAEALILGCTEIGLLIGPQDVTLPVFDTTRYHCEAAVDFATRTEGPKTQGRRT
jgi:aspartate racemase